eukprot:tig00021222_g19358.t1
MCYGGQSVKNVDQLKYLFPDQDNDLNGAESPMLEWTDMDLSLYGFKDAIIYWPKVSYHGGAGQKADKYNITLFRYIRGANGYAPDKYQNFYVAGTVDGDVNFAYATNIQPSHCYGMGLKLCNSVGCCSPSSNPLESSVPFTTEDGKVLAPIGDSTWFQPSQNYANKNSREPTDRGYCVAIKPIGVVTKSLVGAVDFSGVPAEAATTTGTAGSAARSASTASSSGTSNTLLAVAIAVPVGIAGLAIGAVLAAMVITRNQVRAATMAAVSAGSRGQTLNIQPASNASFDPHPRPASNVMLMGSEESAHTHGHESANMRHREAAAPEFDV